jgi:hypothetical protein
LLSVGKLIHCSLQNFLTAVFTDTTTETGHAAWVNGQLMLEILLAAEVLPVRIFHPPHNDLVIRKRIHVFEVLQSDHLASRFGWTAIVWAIQFAKGDVEAVPVDQISELVELVPLIEHVVQTVAEQVGGRRFIGCFWTHFLFPELQAITG